MGPTIGESPKYNRDVTYHEEGVVEVEHLRAHEIFGTNSAENHNVTPNSLITKNTNSTASIETSKGLSYLGEKN
jgi:hypothetical protein